jgi:DNA-directed RNA polymerase subunit K/omega
MSPQQPADANYIQSLTAAQQKYWRSGRKAAKRAKQLRMHQNAIQSLPKNLPRLHSAPP